MDEAELKKFIENSKVTREKTLEFLKKDLIDKKFSLESWKSPKDNPNWSHDHCEICNKEISNLEDVENEAYTDEGGFYWICNACFKIYQKSLGLD